MKLRRASTPNPFLIFLAPSLCLALVLTFFLLLSSSFLLQPGISVNVPQSPFLLSPQRDPRVVTVTAPPLSAVFFENEKMDFARLREKLRSLPKRSQTIIIKADRHALYETITDVMNVALELGFPVVLATADESAEP